MSDAVTSPRFLTVSDAGAVRTIAMSNPGRRNAVPANGWAELADAFDDFEASDQRVLVLRGADGDFCAGADLHDLDAAELSSAADNLALMQRNSAAALRLARVSKPTIAAVEGVAVGAGMNLAIGCDIVLATSDARFSEIFVRRGLAMDMGGTWLLPQLVGLARAKELALTGRVIDAAEALEIGLVAAVVDGAAMESAIADMVGELLQGAPLAQRFVKNGLARARRMTLEQTIAFENQAQAVLLASEDLAEGAAAFTEKRSPDFRGR